jgi:hypothetical protein
MYAYILLTIQNYYTLPLYDYDSTYNQECIERTYDSMAHYQGSLLVVVSQYDWKVWFNYMIQQYNWLYNK